MPVWAAIWRAVGRPRAPAAFTTAGTVGLSAGRARIPAIRRGPASLAVENRTSSMDTRQPFASNIATTDLVVLRPARDHDTASGPPGCAKGTARSGAIAEPRAARGSSLTSACGRMSCPSRSHISPYELIRRPIRIWYPTSSQDHPHVSRTARPHPIRKRAGRQHRSRNRRSRRLSAVRPAGPTGPVGWSPTWGMPLQNVTASNCCLHALALDGRCSVSATFAPFSPCRCSAACCRIVDCR